MKTFVNNWGFVSLPVAALVIASCGAFESASNGSNLSEAEKTRIAEEYRDCMTEGGLEAEVNFDGGVNIDVDGGDMSDEQALAIEAECEMLLEDLEDGPELTPAQEAQAADAMLEVQQCVAEEGYVVDISPDGGIGIDSENQPDDYDESAYLETEEQCLKTADPELYELFGQDN